MSMACHYRPSLLCLHGLVKTRRRVRSWLSPWTIFFISRERECVHVCERERPTPSRKMRTYKRKKRATGHMPDFGLSFHLSFFFFAHQFSSASLVLTSLENKKQVASTFCVVFRELFLVTFFQGIRLITRFSVRKKKKKPTRTH